MGSGSGSGVESDGSGLGPDVANEDEAARLVHAYGLVDRATVVDAVLWWQERCWSGIEAAEAGEPAMIRLRDSGAADRVRAEHQWTRNAKATLERALW